MKRKSIKMMSDDGVTNKAGNDAATITGTSNSTADPYIECVNTHKIIHRTNNMDNNVESVKMHPAKPSSLPSPPSSSSQKCTQNPASCGPGLNRPTMNNTRDRKDHLESSITKIQAQIIEVEKELELICEQLRASTTQGKLTGSTLSSSTLSNSEQLDHGDRSVNAVPAEPITNADNDHSTFSINEDIIRQARGTVETHIKKLTRYNDMKDVAMGLLGMIAEYRGVRLGEVLREWEVEDVD